jgi:hypothetical protein
MPPPEFERPDSKGNILFMLASIALICGGIVTGVFLWIKGVKPGSQKFSGKSESIRASIHFEGPYVTLRNENNFSWGDEMLVYVGNAPPRGYSHHLGIVYPGDTISLALNEFVNGNGEKLNVYGLGFTEAWIGSEGQTFQNFQEAGDSSSDGSAAVVKR